MSTLRALQEQLLQAIVGEPDGLGWASGADAARRVGVYRRAYRLRLLRCMQAELPVLERTLGPPLFRDFVLCYLAACPPRSWTLADLGAGFADFLERERPDGHPGFDLMVDLARLERAHAEAWRGRRSVLTLRFPLGPLLEAGRQGRDAPLPRPAAWTVEVLRQGDRVVLRA